MGVALVNPKQFFKSAAGGVLANGTVQVYVANSTTPTNTWQDEGLTSLNTNPIQLDSGGSCVIWVDPAVLYKFVVYNAGGALQYTIDNIKPAEPANLRALLAASSGSSLVGFIQSGTGAVARTAQDKMREIVTPQDFGAVADGVTNDAPFIRLAIAAVAGTGKYLDFGGHTYLCNSTETPLSYEVVSPIFRLPDATINIIGSGATLQSGTAETFLCMLQTTFGSTAKINVSGLKIRGTGNDGGASYALVDGVVLNAGTQNAMFDLEEIDRTNRHGVFIIHNASRNYFRCKTISNTNRQSLGCGVQIEGASDNVVIVDKIYNIGANGVDVNQWNTSTLYPNPPYAASGTYESYFNKIFVKSIEGTGVNTDSLYNPDDDYFGVNIFNGNNTTVEVGEIKGVRTSNGAVAPALSTYAAAIRLSLGAKNVVRVGKVSIVGPSDAGAVAKLDSPKDSTVEVLHADYYTEAVLLNSGGDTAGSRLIIRNVQGSISPESVRGLNFKFLGATTCTTSLLGVVSGWEGDFGLTFAANDNGLYMVVDASLFKKIYKRLNFTTPYVIVNFEYNQTVTSGTPTAGIDAYPYTVITLRDDATWIKSCVLIPNVGNPTTFSFSPNNSGSAAAGSALTVRNVSITMPDGTTVYDSETVGWLITAPGIGTYEQGDQVINLAATVGQPKGWLCTVAGNPGTWVSMGNL